MAASLKQVESESPGELKRRRRAIGLTLQWLEQFPGETWQQRWVASGSDAGGRPFPDESDRGRRALLFKGIRVLICLRVVQPEYLWLMGTTYSWLFSTYRQVHDPAGFDRLEERLADMRILKRGSAQALVTATRICMRNGYTKVADITAQDIIEIDRDQRSTNRSTYSGHEALWRALHALGQITEAPTLMGQNRLGQQSIEQLVDRYGLKNSAVRDLIVDYIKDRSPGLDYTSVSNLTFWIAKLFWADLEQHHPGIASLHLDSDVAAAWKKRVGRRVDRAGNEVARINKHHVLATVRAFYLDISQLSFDEPERWAEWVAPCPVRKSELASRPKQRASVVSRMHARTRVRMEYVGKLVDTARHRRDHATTLLKAATGQPAGAKLKVDGAVYKVEMAQIGARAVARLRTSEGGLINATAEELEAFWAWASIEVLRLSGLRIEEMMELTHLSIRRYTQPDGKVVPLLQVAPSKIDTERVFPISPELAHVLARIVERVRAGEERVPLCPRYDTIERVFGTPLPHLFQRPYGGGHQVFSPAVVRNWLDRTAVLADIRDVDGEQVRFVPHDFRRMFATEAVNGGLPIHIAAAILGHKTLETTRSYAAIYPKKVIAQYQKFITNRRVLRPDAEYRTPTADEWAEFEQHFTLRDVAYGSCVRPYGSPCAHEHACVRCPMLRPSPSRLPLLDSLEKNLDQRVFEAKKRNWLGEVEGLQQTLVGLREKKAQVKSLTSQGITDDCEPME